MSKLYLEKYKKNFVKTTKNTIVANIDKLNRDYEYKKSIFKSEPKELILVGRKLDFNYAVNLINFPIEKVIIDTNIHSHYQSLKGFYNTKELEMSENSKRIEIYNNYGLINLEKLIIPFTIKSFENFDILNNKIKTITIKYENTEHIIELDDIFYNTNLDISITNINDKLNINLEGKYSSVKYIDYIENNDLRSIKKYINYEILPNNDKILDLYNFRKEYNCRPISNKPLTNETIIISKQDYSFLLHSYKNNKNLKEIIIKDNNEMSLLPRYININLEEDSKIKKIEEYNDKLMLCIEKFAHPNKFILINNDLSYVEFVMEYTGLIKRMYFDFDATNFNLYNEGDRYIITIPFKENSFNNKGSDIITYLMKCSNEIHVRSKGNDILIPKYDSNCNGFIRGIKRYEKNDFRVTYYEYINGRKVYKLDNYILYKYDEYNKSYNDSYSNEKKLIKR